MRQEDGAMRAVCAKRGKRRNHIPLYQKVCHLTVMMSYMRHLFEHTTGRSGGLKYRFADLRRQCAAGCRKLYVSDGGNGGVLMLDKQLQS